MDPSALGRYLRESREAKELTLEDAVTALRIRRPILEAFEQGDFSVVDTPVQMRGLLRNYARFLDLEEDRVLQYYEAAISPKRRRSRFSRRKREPELAAPRRITDTPPALPAVQIPENNRRTRRPKRNHNLLRNIALVLVSLAALSVIVFVITSMLRPPAPTAQPTALVALQPSAETTAPATFIPTSTPLQPTNTLDFAGQGFIGLAIRMEMTQRSWVRIVTDDVEQFAGILEPDEVVDFDANNQVQITAANAAAVRLTVNGQEQPPFGVRGQQADVSISTAGIAIVLEGEVSPTPQLPTNTLMPTATSFIPTATATAVQVNIIGQPTVATSQSQQVNQSASALPSPTSIFAEPASAEIQPSPTPIFESANTDAQSDGTTEADTTLSIVNPSATPQPTATPTESNVVLPLRATPANPIPTKAG